MIAEVGIGIGLRPKGNYLCRGSHGELDGPDLKQSGSNKGGRSIRRTKGNGNAAG